MKCPFCEHSKAHKHGRTSKGSQRFKCPSCGHTFVDTFDTLHYRRQVLPEQIDTILQAHTEGGSLRGISRIGQRAYGTVVSLVRAASHKAQLVHNGQMQKVDCEKILSDEMWSFVKKTEEL